ncbi:MAG: threonine ammonia-lyase, biosynthetic [Cellvibrionales bacterium]|nr:threonine ammonia-lyase, biosynthetic [Cellvibrionales bacterium]
MTTAPLIKAILSANVYQAAIETPIQRAKFLSAKWDNNIWIKREDLQPVYSFKIRGAFNKMRQLSEAQLAKGVVAASAGNHAQGVAFSAKQLGCKATIVMPKTTPSTKINGVKSFGGKVVLHGDAFDEALAHAIELVEAEGSVFIPPYDDWEVIAGQGSMGIEILKQLTDPIDILFLPVGGGGLAAGVSAYIKYVNPDIKIVAVEPEDAACLKVALEDKKRTTLKEVGLFADGVAVAQIGKRPYDILKETVDDVVTASTDDICDAIKDIFEDTRSIAEPAGALSLAGLKNYCKANNLSGKNLVVIESGANTNFDRLRYICERSHSGEKREAVFSVQIPEKVGSFKKFCQTIGKRNISEFNYRYNDESSAQIFLGVEIKSSDDKVQLVTKLESMDYGVKDLSDNDMAKDHVRYMVGGRSQQGLNERVYTFEFPERPGALMNFLASLGNRWSISMFHYRNHGSAWGRVLVGLLADDTDANALKDVFDSLGYPFKDETENPAYSDFL